MRLCDVTGFVVCYDYIMLYIHYLGISLFPLSLPLLFRFMGHLIVRCIGARKSLLNPKFYLRMAPGSIQIVVGVCG